MNTAQNRETEAHLEQLRAMIQAANAIAHDIDIAIAPIAQYTDALLAQEPLSERARHYLSSMRRAVNEVANTAHRLRALDRPGEQQFQAIDSGRRLGSSSPARSLRVLVIDDDPSLIEALRSSLIDEGHKVNTASGGQAGIDSFRAAGRSAMPFDIVITDLAMPDVDGREVVASLRAISPDTPIILLTGWKHQLSDGPDRSLQVDRLMSKPPRIRELRAALAELTGRRAADRLLMVD
ncbi:MAG: response regulator [Pseudomonadota bacterium]